MTDIHFDCIIVGAGLSGLSAADKLASAGLSFLVLEARDRVGGKTWSVQPEGLDYRVDVGAAWINDTNQSEVYALAEKLRLELVVQNTTGNVIQEDINGGLSVFAYGQAPTSLHEPDGLDDMLNLRQTFEDACQEIDITGMRPVDQALDQISLREWIRAHSHTETALASASVWTRAMLGLEPNEISALHFLNYCKSGGGLLQMRKDTKDGGQYLRFVQGSQGLSFGLASRLPSGSVLLNHPVSRITQSAGTDTGSPEVIVETCTTPVKVFTASQLILTIPSPLYKSIIFEPSLPKRTTEFAASTTQGYTNKIIVLYKSPWWRQANLCGLLQSFVGPITVTRDSSVDQVGQFSLTCFLVGKFGRVLSQMSQQDRFDAVVAHIERVFIPFCKEARVAIEEPMAIVEHEWANDAFSGGCPVPCAPPGVLTEHEMYGRVLQEPSGLIHHAGTETSFEWKGYMDGALRSGLRSAHSVLSATKNRT